MKALIVAVLGSLVRIAAVEHMRLAIHRYILAMLLGMVAAISAMVALGYALGGLWFWLLPKLGPIGAYGVIAGGMAVISAILAVSAASILRGRRRSPVSPVLPALPTLHGGQFAHSGMAGLASAAIAGFIVGLLRGRK